MKAKKPMELCSGWGPKLETFFFSTAKEKLGVLASATKGWGWSVVGAVFSVVLAFCSNGRGGGMEQSVLTRITKVGWIDSPQKLLRQHKPCGRM